MNLKELSTQLQGKRRTVTDLARFISTRTDHNPNYTLLLGAGCSISSGIRSAHELIKEWRNELCLEISDVDEQRAYLKQNYGDWYDPNREYSSLFERKFDLQRQRRMFVEKEVASKTPSLGYAYLTSLVNQNYFNTVFTTNFDDLINEAFYLYSDQRPIVCAHDSSINSITVTSKRPKIIKLHGDYLFDDLKSTARETESLEQNMKAKFSEFAKDYGLIVVGYAGNDRSLMDVIATLLKNDDYFKGGIYWCLRPDSEVSEDLRKLMWKEKVYFVEIDGFDELFCELHGNFNRGEVLPISTLSVSRRPTEIIHRLISVQDSQPSPSLLLNKAKDELIKQSKRTTLMNMIFRDSKDENKNGSREKISDDELITQIEIQDLITSCNYRDAIAKGRAAIQAGVGRAANQRILKLICQGHRLLDEKNEAVSVAEELIELHPFTASPLLLKADILQDFDKKLEAINLAIKANPTFVQSYLNKAIHLQKKTSCLFGEDRTAMANEAISTLEVGLTKDPSISNPCWIHLFDLIKEYESDKNEREKKLTQLIAKLSEQDPDSFIVLTMRSELFSDNKNKGALDELLIRIGEVMRRNPHSSNLELHGVRLKVLTLINDEERLKSAIDEIEALPDSLYDSEISSQIANLKRQKFGLDEDAVATLNASLQSEDPIIIKLLFNTLLDLNRIEEAEKLLNQWNHKLSPESKSDAKISLLDAKKDYDQALSETQKLGSLTGINSNANVLYYFLKKGKYREAEQLGKDILTPINYCLDAEAEIINYELACKRLKQSFNKSRLEKLLDFTKSPDVKAAINAVLDKKSPMLDNIKIVMEKDKTFRFLAERWPAFDDYRKDPDFIKAFSFQRS